MIGELVELRHCISCDTAELQYLHGQDHMNDLGYCTVVHEQRRNRIADAAFPKMPR